MPLDHALPLWQAYVVDDVEGGSALITRCHHCMADGTAMMTVTQRLFDPAPGAKPMPAPRARGASVGSGAVFVLNTLLAAMAFVTILRWRSQPRTSTLPGERFVGAMRVGWQHVMQSPRMKSATPSNMRKATRRSASDPSGSRSPTSAVASRSW